MMNNRINADMESQRIRRNLTNTQKKENYLTREGLIVNSFIKDKTSGLDEFVTCENGCVQCQNLTESYDTLLISDNAKMPEKLNEREVKKEKQLLPICAATTGVMGALAGVTAFIKNNAKQNLNIDYAKKLPSLTRNLSINEETHQAVYRMIQAPNKKTIIAGAGVLTLSAMAFMGKTFIDGFKDIWVKRKEADIQKNLQENLIDVETQSFSGKTEIIRSMLSQKAKDFNMELGEPKAKEISFSGKKNEQSKADKQSNFLKNAGYFAIGAASIASIIGLGFVSMKNLRKSDAFIKQGKENIKKGIDKIIENSNARKAEEVGKENFEKMKELDGIYLENMFIATEAAPDTVAEKIGQLNWGKEEKEKYLEKVLFNMRKSTEKADSALGGTGKDKPSFYSHVNDYRAFFYNWLIDSSNPQFRNLFMGITGVTAATYAGEVAGGAVKDVQVKKYNAETELELQKRLVSTELRNFKSKKDSAIQPLCDEFYKQKENGKSKEELKVMADNILLEIKNGAPFVYS